MKNLFFYSLLLMVILVSSCGKNGTPEPELPDEPKEIKANFKVIYSQSGDLENFSKALTISEGFLYEDSNEEVPIGLFNEDLSKSNYIFNTKAPLKEVELGVTLGWMPTTSKPSSMTVLLEVYQGDKLIDSQELKVTSDDVSDVFQFKYEAK